MLPPVNDFSGMAGAAPDAKTGTFLGGDRQCGRASKDVMFFEAHWQCSTTPDVLHSVTSGFMKPQGYFGGGFLLRYDDSALLKLTFNTNILN